MTRTTGLLLIGLFALVAAAVLFPLRLALQWADAPLSARSVSGSVWNGTLEDANWGPVPLGDLSAGLRFWSLLSGQARFHLSSQPGSSGPAFDAVIARGMGTSAIENANATVDLTGMTGPLPVTALVLERVHVRFSGRQCRSAGGQVRVTLDANIPGFNLKSGLLGKPRCEGERVVLPLVSGSGMENLTLAMTESGAYDARLFIEGQSGPWTTLLPALGFVRAGNGYGMTRSGQF